ncbi:hypothetical protein INT48_007207 [Thamnidium elegans]|uniref:Uncharacterized protein n=1 Tax=Thamnidium elegans TaxID=101142 RepID=A0A8H7VNM3_9FUNG|nr:hypothetical protein INT48_007207 [Thamnidium elegans]
MHQQQIMSSTQQDPLIKLPKPSSLLLKRLAPKHGHKKNLTIMTPSYNEDSVTNGIQSAPLRKTTIACFHQGSNKNKVVKRSPPSSLSTTMKSSNKPYTNNVPATASAASAPWPKTSAQARFPSPPIVPSQQPAWAQYRHQLKTANVPNFPRTPVNTVSPQPQPQQHLSQKQKFLQPFEYLYDNIEQTRVLKTTLDDQIRRSSSLMQTLQSSGTMVESLVRRQVHDMMDERFEARLRECTDRITRLEYRVPTIKDIPISPAVSPSPTTATSMTKEQPVIKDLLAQLMNRIDQLEKKLDK